MLTRAASPPIEEITQTAALDWRPLWLVAGRSAFGAALLTPVTIAGFMLWPPPYDGRAREWFDLLQDNPLLGLVSLDLLYVVITALMVPLMVGLCVALRRVRPAHTTIAAAIFVVAVGGLFASNPAVEM